MDNENISDNQSTEIMDDENISDNQPTEKMDGTTVDEEMTVNNKDYIEYEDEMDTSDEEDIRNTVGNIPMNWYDEYSHIGYDWDGAKIVKPERGDQLDNFMEKMENPDFWRTVRDLQTGQDVVLSDKDVELIQRIESSKIPDSTYEEYGPWIEWFTSEVMDMPIRNGADHKRSFIASRSEASRVERYARLIRAGLLKTREQKRREREKKRQRSFFMMWSTDDAEDENMRRITDHIPAPKRNLPSHAESYNPPPEFLFNDREMRIWNKQEETPWKRKLHYVPQKFNSLRQVPAYPKFIKERFTRCLDLYLCPRARKMRLTIEPEDLLPKLPSPKDLQPFPTIQSLVYNGHTDMVRCISIDPLGQFLLSGSDDMTVKIWEISTARCMRTIPVGGIVRGVEWNPNKALSMIAVIADRKLLIINPGIGDHLVVSRTDSILSTPPIQTSIVSDKIKAIVQWDDPTTEEYENGIRIVLNHFKELKQVTWHGRGDYCATVMPDGANRSVLIHQMSTRRSQLPFAKSKGLVQSVLFHPIRPFLFVATQKNIRIYDLVKQELFKKLMSYAKWISSMAIHPGGDNLIVGTYDRKMLWFDLDLSTKPYKTLRLHSTAIRSVAFHKRYPLFASGSDDRALIVSHGMVYNDLLQNPLVVPLKMLKEHEEFSDFGIFGVIFHPTEPWVFSCGADKTIRLFT